MQTLALLAGGGDTGEELDISLLRITLFHEYWQGLLHQLDLATLRANSAVSLTPFNSKTNDASAAATPTEQPASRQLSSAAASVTPSASTSPAQNLAQSAASATSLAEQGEQGRVASSSSSSNQGAASAQVVDRLQEPETQASNRQVAKYVHCMIAYSALPGRYSACHLQLTVHNIITLICHRLSPAVSLVPGYSECETTYSTTKHGNSSC